MRITSQLSGTNSLLGSASLHILVNYYQPLIGALCVKGVSVKYLFIGLLLISSNIFATEKCPYDNDDKASLLSESLSIVNLPLGALELFNSGQPDEAKQLLINDLTSSIIAMDILLSHKGCTYPKNEVERTMALFKTLARMNEIYPVPEWEVDPKIQSIFQKAIRYEATP